MTRQIDARDAKLQQIAARERWAGGVQTLTRFRGIATLTALGLIAEIGDFARLVRPRELASWLGITPSEYSSGDQQHRGHITRAGNHHARRLLIEAAWHYRYAPHRPSSGPQPDERAWQAQVRLHHRYRHLIEHGKRATVAIARELAGFLGAAMTDQPRVLQGAHPTMSRLIEQIASTSRGRVRAAGRGESAVVTGVVAGI